MPENRDESLVCPNCGSTDLEKVSDNKVRCRYCKNVHRLSSLRTLSGKQSLVICPICMKEIPVQSTFTCPKCGRPNICMRHLKRGLCTDCARDPQSERIAREDTRMKKERKLSPVVGVILLAAIIFTLGILFSLVALCNDIYF